MAHQEKKLQSFPTLFVSGSIHGHWKHRIHLMKWRRLWTLLLWLAYDLNSRHLEVEINRAFLSGGCVFQNWSNEGFLGPYRWSTWILCAPRLLFVLQFQGIEYKNSQTEHFESAISLWSFGKLISIFPRHTCDLSILALSSRLWSYVEWYLCNAISALYLGSLRLSHLNQSQAARRRQTFLISSRKVRVSIQ